MAPTPHLSITGLTKRFGDFTALDQVHLSVARGELLTLLGPSGCGKTTLLRVIAGFLRQDGGSIQVAGRVIDQVPPDARNFGMVFQSYAVFPHLTVAENVGYGLVARRTAKPEIARRVAAALARVQLDPLAARFPDALSGGQKQRVGLARAMVIEPDLLLMDEPLSNLDAMLRIEMRREIRLMQRELAITTIYVTHDQEEALAISDRIAVMQNGRLLQVAAPVAIFEAPTHAFVADFIGGCNWFPATLHHTPDGDTITLAAGPHFALANRTGHPPGPVRLALRNEDFHLAGAHDAPDLCLHGRVVMHSYMGQRTRLHIALAATASSLDVDLPSGPDLPRETSPIRLAFNPERARLFALDDGRRIA